jgi:hypothetical protein
MEVERVAPIPSKLASSATQGRLNPFEMSALAKAAFAAILEREAHAALRAMQS